MAYINGKKDFIVAICKKKSCTIVFDLGGDYYNGGDIEVVYTDANGNTVEDTLQEGYSYELTVACDTLLYMSGTDLYFGGTAETNGLVKLVEHNGKGVYRVTTQTGTFKVVFDNS